MSENQDENSPKSEELSRPLVDDEEFIALMSKSHATSSQDEMLLERVNERLMKTMEITKSSSSSFSKKDLLQTLQKIMAYIRQLSFARFLMYGAALSLVFGIIWALIMIPPGEVITENDRQVDVISIPITMNIYHEDTSSGEKELISGDVINDEGRLSFSIAGEQPGYYSFIAFRDEERFITSPGMALRSGEEQSVEMREGDPIHVEAQGDDEGVTFCVLATDTMTRLKSLLNSYDSKAGVLTVAHCRDLKIRIKK